MTAKITNIISQKDQVLVYVSFEGKEEEFVFNSEITKDQIKERVKTRLADYNKAETAALSLNSLVNLEIK